MTADPEALGRFEVAIIETHAILIPGSEDRALCEFFDDSALNDDASNCWVPNEKALVGLCRAAGFRKVECVSERPAEPPPRDPLYYRAIVHAWR